MQFSVTEIHKMSGLRAKPGLSLHLLLFRFEPYFLPKFGLNIDRQLVIRFVENHQWFELDGNHPAKTIRLHLDLIAYRFCVRGLRRALLLLLTFLPCYKRAGENKHQCTRENWSHDSSPLSI